LGTCPKISEHLLSGIIFGVSFGAIELAIVSSGVTWLASSSAAVIGLSFGGGDHRGDRAGIIFGGGDRRGDREQRTILRRR
jgi:hypothetical protein